MTTTDSIELRGFQADLAFQVANRIADGEAVTVAWCSAGSGKTLAWQHIANQLYRDHATTHVACFVPRKTLREQAEIDWETVAPRYAQPRMRKVVERENHAPLTDDSRHDGFISTYAALVSSQRNPYGKDIHLSWAREHAGRFLLVCDEAQFLGIDEDGSGTQAAQRIVDLAKLAYHTILLTGTPYRSDGNRLALASYTEPNNNREIFLNWHVRARYLDGVSGGYLRPVQADLAHGSGEFTSGEEFDIETLEQHLGHVLRHPKVWQPLVDNVVDRLDQVQGVNSHYRGLIAVATQAQAAEVQRYLQTQHPHLRTVKAVSDDGAQAKQVLKNFRSGRGDILVTVAMAHIGYDCKNISVVGLLTATRWDAYLQQLVARGLRVRDDRPVGEQTCYVVGPADPKLQQFCEKLRRDAEQGIRERETTRGPGGSGDDDPVVVDDVELTGTVALGMDADSDLTADERQRLAHIRSEMSLHISETQLGEAVRKWEQYRDNPPAPETREQPTPPPETEIQARDRLGRECGESINALIRARWGITSRSDHERWLSLKKDLTYQWNKYQNVKSTRDASPAQLEERKRQLIDQVVEARKGRAA